MTSLEITLPDCQSLKTKMIDRYVRQLKNFPANLWLVIYYKYLFNNIK